MISPSQTVGPFFGYALPYGDGPYVTPQWRPDAIMLRGRVLDGAGQPLPDALVEIWQPDGAGTLALARGLLKPVFTRVYFPGEPGNVTDPVLSQVDAARRDTLIAQPDGDRAY